MKLMIYKIIRPKNVTEEYVRELAARYFDIPETAQMKILSTLYNLRTNTLSFCYYPENGFFDISQLPEAKKHSNNIADFPDPNECLRIAKKYVLDHCILQESDIKESHVSENVNPTGFGARTVRFKGEIEQYETFGGGMEVTIYVGVKGEIVKLIKTWLKYEPYKFAKTKTPKEAFEELQNNTQTQATSSGEVTDISIVYSADSITDYLRPFYRFRITNSDDAFVSAIQKEYIKSKEQMKKEQDEERKQREEDKKTQEELLRELRRLKE